MKRSRLGQRPSDLKQRGTMMGLDDDTMIQKSRLATPIRHQAARHHDGTDDDSNDTPRRTDVPIRRKPGAALRACPDF